MSGILAKCQVPRLLFSCRARLVLPAKTPETEGILVIEAVHIQESLHG
jgi:hypothetical protein